MKSLSNKHLGSTSLLAVAISSAISAPMVSAKESEPLASDQQENEVKLEMVQVAGQATSGLDELITQEHLENIQASDLSDIFRSNPMVTAGGAVGMSQKIYVRNTGEDMLNISVDGAEQSGAVFHHAGRIVIEPDLLKQVEIEAGAGSATAGPGALGGSVRFTTKDPEDLLKPNEQAGALLKSGYYSNGDSQKNSATVFGSTESGSISGLVNIISANFNNQDDADGDEIIGSEVEKASGYAKIVGQLSASQKLSLSYESIKEEGNVLYRPEWLISAKNPVSFTEATRDTAVLNYRLNPANPLLNFSVNTYKTKQEQDREYGDTGVSYDGYVESIGATIENKTRLSRHEVIYGINYRDDKSVLHDATATPANSEETGLVQGIYVQDIYAATDNLTLTAGARYDEYELTDIHDQDIKNDGVSPNLSANYMITSELSVSAGYAEALRGAQVRDAFKNGSITVVNDKDLKAEKAKNTELGIDYASNNMTLAAGVYRSVIENPIGGTTPWAKDVINLEDDIETTGYFASARYHTHKINAGISFNSAETELDGDVVTRYVYGSSATSIGDTLIVDVNYQITDNLIAGWNAEFVDDINNIEAELDGNKINTDKPGYSVHDVYTRWEPLGSDLLTLNLTVKNLFNKQYLHHASPEDFTHHAGYEMISGQPEAGRDIRLTASVRI